MLPFPSPELNPRLELGDAAASRWDLIFTFLLNPPLRKEDFGGPSFLPDMHTLKRKTVANATVSLSRAESET